MKRDTYRNLTELNQHIHEKWYAEDWEKGKKRVNVVTKALRHLAVVLLILGFWIVVFAPSRYL